MQQRPVHILVKLTAGMATQGHLVLHDKDWHKSEVGTIEVGTTYTGTDEMRPTPRHFKDDPYIVHRLPYAKTMQLGELSTVVICLIL